MEITLVTDNEALKAICQQISHNNAVAVDTEFKRETTYFPKACLIQLAIDDLTVCVDPLSITNFEPLKAILYSPKITKIFHAARQDLEIFYLLFNEIPQPIFDTQIASALLGGAEQVGYATLVKKILNVELDKSLTRANWEKRPIPDKQLIYAANDVIYLLKIYQHQIQALETCGRREWLANAFDFLLDKNLYRPDPDSAWKRIKNTHRLPKEQRCIVFKLAQWRETTALKRNKPRTFIIKNQSILDIAHQQPITIKELHNIKELHPSFIRRDGETVLKLVQSAKSMHEDACPSSAINQPLSNDQLLMLSDLQILIQLKAKENNIDSSYLSTKKELEKLIRQEDSVLLHGWRYELAGRDAVKFINGKLILKTSNGAVKLSENQEGGINIPITDRFPY